MLPMDFFARKIFAILHILNPDWTIVLYCFLAFIGFQLMNQESATCEFCILISGLDFTLMAGFFVLDWFLVFLHQTVLGDILAFSVLFGCKISCLTLNGKKASQPYCLRVTDRWRAVLNSACIVRIWAAKKIGSLLAACLIQFQ